MYVNVLRTHINSNVFVFLEEKPISFTHTFRKENKPKSIMLAVKRTFNVCAWVVIIKVTLAATWRQAYSLPNELHSIYKKKE